VDPPYESHPGFFYPTGRPQVIHTAPPESRPLDASRAKVTLAEIPFVRLRELMDRSGAKGDGFAATVEAVQREVTPTLAVDYEQGRVVAGSTRLEMRPAELAFYAMMAAAAKEGRGVACPPGGEDERLAAAFLNVYRRWGGERGIERTEKALKAGMSREYFLERVSRVNAALEKQLGPDRAVAYRIHAVGRRPETEYRLHLAPGSIRFHEARDRRDRPR
jgi:hypothetical protein